MSLIFELLFRGLIVNFMGLNLRYYFFKFIGKERQLDYLAGKKPKHDSNDIIIQHFFNVVIGLTVFILLFFVITYSVYKMGFDL